MASPLSAAATITALKKWNVNYEEWPGWQTRTRPGSSTPVGFVQHHTGGAFTHSSSYLKFLFETGRPAEGIPGPLCNFAITDDGVCWIGSRLRTNNAGSGDSDTLALIRSEDYAGYTSEIKPNENDLGTGNQWYWGVEICYPGTVAMRSAQYATAVLLGAALMDAYGWTALSTLAHREHSPRKWDPGQMSLSKFRTDVRARLNAGPEGEDMPTKAEFFVWMSEWWTTKMNIDGGPFAPNAETARLRAAPIQQMIGRVQPDGSFINVHTVMGEAHLLAQYFGINNPNGPHPLLDALLAANDDETVKQSITDALAEGLDITLTINTGEPPTP